MLIWCFGAGVLQDAPPTEESKSLTTLTPFYDEVPQAAALKRRCNSCLIYLPGISLVRLFSLQGLKR